MVGEEHGDSKRQRSRGRWYYYSRAGSRSKLPNNLIRTSIINGYPGVTSLSGWWLIRVGNDLVDGAVNHFFFLFFPLSGRRVRNVELNFLKKIVVW